jgi:hypothetical protein
MKYFACGSNMSTPRLRERVRLGEFVTTVALLSALTPCQIHKPSTAVSFGLPDHLSFRVRQHAMVIADRGQTPTGKASGSGRQARLTRHLREMQCRQRRRSKSQNARSQRRARRRSMRLRRYRWSRKTFLIWSQWLPSQARCCSGFSPPGIFNSSRQRALRLRC